MPIVDIEIVVADHEELPPHLAQTLANELGAVFGASPGQTWVRLHKLPLDCYAEDGDMLSQEVKPVFVTILKATLPPPADIQREIEAITSVVARVCLRPVENVHLFYAPERRGRVAFGGRLAG